MTARADIFSVEAPRLFSIDSGRPFLLDLARALHASAGGDPIALADMLVFLPTRRAVRGLTDAFIEASGARASLLPRIRALGDVDEDEFALDEPGGADSLELPPAISMLERRLVLARLVAAADRAFAGQENWSAAIAAAKELSALLDSFYAEEISFDRLAGLAPAEHAAHWARSLKFLRIITEEWPRYLAASGLIDPAERRARLIGMQAARLERLSPSFPVIVAGTTGSAPAVARLMRVVSGLPRGAVVLPGLDRGLTEDAKGWGSVDDPHPQAGLKALLKAADATPGEVRTWPGGGAPSPRARLVSLALRPAEATDDWRELVASAGASDSRFAHACDGLSLIEADDEENEAATVALLLREALEVPERTAMLVTPDRTLGRRVAAKMRRWGVVVDDSAGIPFANSPCGTFLRLVAQWLASPSDPVALLSVVRHPLAGFGLAFAERMKAAIAVDEGLRGLLPAPGIDGLAAKLALDDKRNERAAPILAACMRAYAAWPPAASAPFEDILAAHIVAAETLASDAEESGKDRLWRGEDGEAGSLFVGELRAAAPSLGTVATADFAAAFAQLAAGASVRRRAPTHPRISILGPLEARLQSADLVILGGLNEGVWPGAAAVDPFLSHAMREDLGLPSADRRLGLAAHDFAQLASAPRVALTRARMSGGAPAKPSRWIVRFKNILAAADALAAVDATPRLRQWSSALDRPASVERVQPPAPRPPFEARPRKLYVTRFGDLMRDPYGVYARSVLKLRKLDKLADGLSQKYLGLLLHDVFDRYVRSGCDVASPGARAVLTQTFDEAAAKHGLRGGALSLWRSRLDAALDWFYAWDITRRSLGATPIVEKEGEAAFDAGAAPFTLAARADRIDVSPTGVTVFDYKSGILPSLKQIHAQFSPQLPLTAMIIEAGGFGDLGAVEGFHYVKALNQKDDARDFSGADGDEARALIAEARAGFAALVAAFDNPATPYLSQPRPEFMNKFGDYDHLARRREWASEGEGE